MATMTAQGTLPSAGGDMTAAPVTNTINHVMNTYNGNNIDENNVDYTNSDGVMVLAQAQTRTAALTQKATFTVGVDDTGHDVQFFGATTGKSFLWDESADKPIITGDMSVSGTMTYTSATQFSNTVTVGVDDTGYDVKFFGATTAKSMLWDESADTLIIAGKQTISETLLVTGVGTFTAQSIHNGGLSTGAMVINDGSITDSSGAITFGNENLVTTGTLGAGVATLATGSTVGNLTLANGSITDSSGSITFVNENLVTTGTLGAGASTLGATTATTMDGVIGSVTPAAGTFTTLTANTSITGTLATAAQGNITSLGTIGSLVATTADINGGTVDAVIGGTTPAAGTFTTLIGTNVDGIVGANTPAAGTFTSVGVGSGAITTTGTLGAGATTVTSLNASDGNITNVGDIALDSISADGTTINITATVGINDATPSTEAARLQIYDNTAASVPVVNIDQDNASATSQALSVNVDATGYMPIATTTGNLQVVGTFGSGATFSNINDDATAFLYQVAPNFWGQIFITVIQPSTGQVFAGGSFVVGNVSGQEYCAIMAQTNAVLEASTSNLAGTTGSDTKITVSMHSGGIEIENRYGQQIYVLAFIWGNK